MKPFSDMKRIFLAIGLATFFLTHFSTRTQAQVARLYTTQHGLKTNACRSVDVDSRGFVWVSGYNTLGLFDGTRFQNLPITSEDGTRQLFQSSYGVKEQGADTYWVCSSHGLLLLDARRMKFRHIFLAEHEDSIYGYAVNSIISYPPQDNIWLVTTDGFGTFALDEKTMQVNQELSNKLSDLTADPFSRSPVIDTHGRLWITTMNEPLVCIDLKRMKKQTVNYAPDATALMVTSKVNTILGTDSRLFFGTTNGLLTLDLEQGVVRSVAPPSETLNITSMIESNNHRILIGTDGRGIWELKHGEGDAGDQLVPFTDITANFEIAYSKVTHMAEDREGNVIAALLQKGLVVIPPKNDCFHYHAISPLANGKNATCITSMTIDKAENYWVATDGCGVFTTHGMRLATAYPVNEGLHSQLVQDVKIDKRGTVWAASFGGGVQYLEGGRWTDGGWLTSLNREYAMKLHYDEKNDRMLVGTNGNGILSIDITRRTIEKLNFPFDYNPWIVDVTTDTQGTLWVTTSSGAFYYNQRTGQHSELMLEDNRIDNASSVVQDGCDILIACEKGLLIHNIQTHRQTLIAAEQGLSCLSVRSIVTTPKHIWLATQTNIACIDKQTHKVRNYSSFGGYDIGEFHHHSACKPDSNYILFGGDNGIICFNPELIMSRTQQVNHVYFTSLTTPLHTEQLDANIFYAHRINLASDNGSFTISFSTAELGDPNRIHYDYLLEGHEQQWHTDAPTPTASYTSLPAGNYTLRVRAYLEDNPDECTENTIQIHVAAPWHTSTWAMVIYALIGIGIAYVIYHLIRNRKRQKEQLRQSAELDRIKEAKLRLFTSITHELRSPLTMIESPLKQLMAEDKNDEHQALYSVMQRNCDRLLGIVKQITDIRKIDSGQLTLKLEEQDYVAYSEAVFEQFKGLATVKDISFVVEHSEEELPMMMDVTHFEKIITNILSNAFKFTPQGGKVLARSGVVGCNVELRFYNSGSHLREEDLSHLWERFYQGCAGSDATGSGIGLNLVHELVKLHHGTIDAKNIEPDGVEFTLHFPFYHLATTAPYGSHSSPTKPTLLLVDDDQELVRYISTQLEKDYNVTCAFSGNSGWKKVLALRPEVVVTDYRMPDGNGMELCQRIKNNPETDSTPVIMLTGEGDEMLQLHSLNIQVDHYLEKPVNIMLLRSAISQVLRVRENMLGKVRRTEMGRETTKPTLENAEEKFWSRVNECIRKHLDDSEFSVQQLSDEVGISRVHLNRKMKEHYGMSPNVFIKSFRLKQAAYLLVNNNTNVSEVAYTVGFSSHSYFTTSFHDYFGMSPKEFVAYYSEEGHGEALQKLLE